VQATFGTAFDQFLAKCPKSCTTTEEPTGEKRADGTQLERCSGVGVENIFTPRKSDGHWGEVLCRTTACQDYLANLLSDPKAFYCSPEVLEIDTGLESGATAEETAEYDAVVESATRDAHAKYVKIKDICSIKSTCNEYDTEEQTSWTDAYEAFGTKCSELCGRGQSCEKWGNKCRTASCRKSLAWLDVGRTGLCAPEYTEGALTLADVESKWENIRSICTEEKDLTKDQIQKPVNDDNSSPKLYSLAGTLAGLAFSGLCILLA